MALTTDQTTTAGAAGSPELEPWLDRYGQMLLIREFENDMQRLFLKGEIHGTVHLYVGQEAVSVGVCAALESDDYVAATYRGHGAALAKGTEPVAIAAELMGRQAGANGGRAGSMNVIDLDHGLIGCFGIIGGSIGAATGAALSARRQGRVAVAFFGDGTTNQGYFWECLNFAKVLDLPVVFVCENNLYGEFTPLEKSTAGADIAARSLPLAIPSAKVDGNDVWAVHATATEAVDRARRGDGPTLIEALTYRHLGHSKSDPATYRPKEEVERWKAYDPLDNARRRLLELGASDEQIGAVHAAVRARMDEAIEAALASPYPDPIANPGTEYKP
jgi:TPP-dependent pyruvate/acetoin dehydrogenase alpha subunit